MCEGTTRVSAESPSRAQRASASAARGKSPPNRYYCAGSSTGSILSNAPSSSSVNA